MNKYFLSLMLFIIIIFSCDNRRYKQKSNRINHIINSEFLVFKDVLIPTVGYKNGYYKVREIFIYQNGKIYNLPNYKYYDCEFGDNSCLKKKNGKNFDVDEYANINGIYEEAEIKDFIEKKLTKIINEFKKLNISNVSGIIGNCESCISFLLYEYPSHNKTLYYIKKPNNLKNKYFKENLLNFKKIQENWYLSEE